MDYSILNNQIIVNDLSQFDIKQMLESGQVFRFSEEDGNYKIIAENVICHLKYEYDRAIISSSDIDFAIKYFDLDRDYAPIKQRLAAYPLMQTAIDYGKGIRILNQPPLETIVSFIISANNNIPRIKGILTRLCECLGEDFGEYRAFPTLEALTSEDAAFYRRIGAGYRAEYLVDTVRSIADGFDLNLYSVATPEARKRLMTLKGVGGKVADCILLFAYHKEDVFPMDTWCKRIYRDFSLPATKSCANMAHTLTTMFGDLSGYAQQYLFYYYRQNNII
ncbi:MAG: DNA glycosylase [Clostridia bacterium]|nr:DNA glycosylase [Clostridia bacterium]